jgi:hypothetical protein
MTDRSLVCAGRPPFGRGFGGTKSVRADPVRTIYRSPRKKKSRKPGARDTSGLKRGGPGRPAGVPNKATSEAKAPAEAMVDEPVYREKLALDRGRLKNGDAFARCWRWIAPEGETSRSARPQTAYGLVMCIAKFTE